LLNIIEPAVKLNGKRDDLIVKSFKLFFQIWFKVWPDTFTGFQQIWLQPKKFNLPNLISWLRISLTPILATMIIFDWLNVLDRAIFFTILALSDLLDGGIAKAAKCQTDYGAKLDSYSDKVLFLPLIVLTKIFYQIPIYWLFIAITVMLEITNIIQREVRKANKPYKSNSYGQIKFWLQMIGLGIMFYFPGQLLGWVYLIIGLANILLIKNLLNK